MLVWRTGTWYQLMTLFYRLNSYIAYKLLAQVNKLCCLSQHYFCWLELSQIIDFEIFVTLKPACMVSPG